jgi:hypothetical protein
LPAKERLGSDREKEKVKTMTSSTMYPRAQNVERCQQQLDVAVAKQLRASVT